MTRRTLLSLPGGLCVSAGTPAAAPGGPGRLLFTSGGRTFGIEPDGSRLRPLRFDVPNQATWQPAGRFSDGRLLLLSMEPRRDGPGRPFAEYYHRTPTHLWIYDPRRDRLEEIAHRERLASFYAPQLLIGDDRLLVQVIRENGVGQVYLMSLDGTGAREFTRAGEGLPYGFSASPDGRRVAFHLASPAGYQVWTADPNGANRVRLAARAGHLYFGTSWSPDGRWVAYLDCLYGSDPGHDWADLCIGRADGAEHRVLTEGQPVWFGVTYGGPESRGGGSTIPVWTRDGSILFPRRLPGSRVPWEYQGHRQDVDHFNREFRPELAGGGTQLCRLDPRTGVLRALSRTGEGAWDFRAAPSPDGRRIAFCRCATGEAPALWLMRADGSGARRLTDGPGKAGVDHPRWLR